LAFASPQEFVKEANAGATGLFSDHFKLLKQPLSRLCKKT
jgi:hypothetical protein